jgi:hypothetical protein
MDVVEDVVAIIPHIPGDIPESMYQISGPCVAGASAVETFVVC